jgi:hypothetical protein
MLPRVSNLADLDFSKLSAEGTANYRQVKYDGEHWFLHLPHATFIGTQTFQTDKKINHYLTCNVDEPAVVALQALEDWVRELGDAELHPLIRDDQLKLRLPHEENECAAGVFNEHGTAVDISSLVSGTSVQMIIHLANVWTRGTLRGLLINAVQIKARRRECLIADG